MKKILYLFVGMFCILGINRVKAYDSYEIGDSIYFNPNSGKICDSTQANSDNGVTEGCMKWYVIKKSLSTDDYVKVILDHNVINEVKWDESESANATNVNSISSVKSALQHNTSDWIYVRNISNISTSEITNTIMNSEFNYNGKLEYTTNTDYYYLKNFPNVFYFYKDLYIEPDMTKYKSYNYNLSSTNVLKNSKQYGWLFDNTEGCKQNGCNKESNDTKGYWTSNILTKEVYETSGKKDDDMGFAVSKFEADFGYAVTNNGTLDAFIGDESQKIGIRPTGEIKKEYLVKTEDSQINEKEQEIKTSKTISDLTEKVSIILSENEKNVTESSTVKAKKINSDETKYKEVEKAMQKIIKTLTFKMTLYDINIYGNISVDGKTLQPSDSVKLVLPIPDGYDKTKLVVYRMEDNGSLDKLNYKIDNNDIIVETNHFSLYAIVEDSSLGVTKNPKTGVKQLPMYGIIVAIISSVVFFKIKSKTKFSK